MLLRSRPLFKQFPAPLKVRASPGRSGGEGPWRPYPPPRFSPPLPVSLAPTLSYLSQCLSVRPFVCASGLASLFFCSFSPGTVSPTLFTSTRALPPVPVDSSWPRTTWLLLNTAQRQGALLWMGHGHPHFIHTGCPHPVGCGERTQGQNRSDPKCVCWNHARGTGCNFSHFETFWVGHVHF